jgi:UDP-2-acetamido-2,6-beta-L-arabino-hexul-4-ose reductase
MLSRAKCVLVTGANGFIGKNLIVVLRELDVQVLTYTRDNSIKDIEGLVQKSDFIVHLAGENRPKDEKYFDVVNVGLTVVICEAIRSTGRKIPIILASSTQAEIDNAYGKSKIGAETAVKNLENDTGSLAYIYRLPGVFGKWCKPNYNSVVATFCHNISHNLPIKVDNPDFELNLVYIDDTVKEFISIIHGNRDNNQKLFVQPEYKIKLGRLASQIKKFNESRHTLISDRVGKGLTRKLYSTYVSYLSPNNFSYSVPSYGDDRGVFVEMLKTKDSGQFSFFTVSLGATRGGHYHHSKTEKFLVVKGRVRFGFRHIISNESYEIITSNEELIVVESIPGWSHDIMNIGKEDVIVILWANEIFNIDAPDTIIHEV